MDMFYGLSADETGWRTLYRAGGVAALVAGILFRRNLGVEIGLFAGPQPESVAGWFALLQENRLLGLAYLHLFDVVNYALLALMFLALVVVLRHVNRSAITIAAVLAFLGITSYVASNTALSMLALSDQYARAGEAQRQLLLAAGEGLLALNRFSSGAHPGSAGYASLLLIALAGLLTSFIMLRSALFGRLTAYVGLLAAALDLAYCLAYAIAPGARELLAVLFIPAAGLFLMLWHILVGWRLWRLARG